MSNVIENGNYCVYVHTSPSGKKYVGQTRTSLKKRWRNGEGYLYKYKDSDEYKQPAFARAILKYGWDNFEHEVIASNLTKEDADNFEKLLIEKLDTMNPKCGYNCVGGGNSGNFSEETRRKISEANKGEKHHMYGKHHSEETKMKIGEAHKGLKASEETRRKLSEARKGEKAPMYGKRHTEESKKKMSENRKGKGFGVDSPIAKKVVQYDLDGNLIKIWHCISDAERELNIHNIVGCCQRKPNYKTVGGYIWRYFEDELIEEDIAQCKKRRGRKCVANYTLSGELVCVFESITDAALKTGIKHTHISRCCREVRPTAGGFIWKYYESEDIEIVA